MYHLPLMTCLILLTLSLTFPFSLSEVPAIIVFGDSSVDAGNNNGISTLLKSNHPPYGRDFFGGKATGRFSNGRIPPDFISEGFGLRNFVPAWSDLEYGIEDFAVGVCFASAGTGYDNATSNVLNVIPLWQEVENYKKYIEKLKAYAGTKKANYIITEALYLISIGTNDFLENYYTIPGGRSSQFTIDQYQDFLVGLAEQFLKNIYFLGARKISFSGLIPMGCLPLERATNFIQGEGDKCVKSYNDVAFSFNTKLAGMIKKLNKELHGIKIVFANPYFLFQQIVRKPAMYQFEEVAVACCATGLFEMGYMCNSFAPFTCPDANKYVFWDAFHPTEKTNRIFSDNFLKTLLRLFP